MIGLLENSGRESWLQINEVYVFCFSDVFEAEFSVHCRNSLPFGNHIRSFDLTVQIKGKILIKYINELRKKRAW